MSKIAQRVSLGRTGQGIIVSHIGFDGDGFGTTKQAIIPIDGTKDAEEMLKKAAAIKWKLTGTPNAQNNFVNAHKDGMLSPEVMATAVEEGRSITVTISETADEEAEGEETAADVLQKSK
jgi:hypothetical protein